MNLCDSAIPIELDVVPDTSELHSDDEHEDSSVNQAAFFELDIAEPGDRIRLIDDDGGEVIFFRIDDLAMLTMPLDCCEPTLVRAIDEGDEENELAEADGTDAQ